MPCENCEKLKDELARALAEKAKAEGALINYANKLLLARRALGEVTTNWPEK